MDPAQVLVVLTRHHESFYAPLLADVPAARLVVQPESRGTAPAILYGVLRVAEATPLGTVALFPSDHYVSDDVRFMAHIETAFEAVQARPDLVILLGIQPEGPEVQYGWIEPGDRLLDWPGHPVDRVRRFWEKPALAIAETLLERGCLWNSFVIVARVSALLALIRGAAPELYRTFTEAWAGHATEGDGMMRLLYRSLASMNFSEAVLESRPTNFAVLPVRGVVWSDWGEPARVLRTLGRLGIRPPWAGLATAVGA
jgi:mannose-1-phosphate guanylyltransferase